MGHSGRHRRRYLREGRHRNREQASRSYARVAGVTAGNAMLATLCVTSAYSQFADALGISVGRLKVMVAFGLLAATALPLSQMVSNRHHPSARAAVLAAWAAATAFALFALYPRAVLLGVALVTAAVAFRPLASLRGAGSQLYPMQRVTVQGGVRNWMIAAQGMGGLVFAVLVAFYTWRLATIALVVVLGIQALFLSRWMRRDWNKIAVPRREKFSFLVTPGLKAGCAAVALGMLLLVLMMSGVQGALISRGTTPRVATELIGALQLVRLSAIPYTGWGSRAANRGSGRALALTSGLMVAGGVVAWATLLPTEPRVARFVLILAAAGLLESAGQALNVIVGGELSAVSLATATIVTALNAFAYFAGALLSSVLNWTGTAIFAIAATTCAALLVRHFRRRFVKGSRDGAPSGGQAGRVEDREGDVRHHRLDLTGEGPSPEWNRWVAGRVANGDAVFCDIQIAPTDDPRWVAVSVGASWRPGGDIINFQRRLRDADRVRGVPAVTFSERERCDPLIIEEVLEFLIEVVGPSSGS